MDVWLGAKRDLILIAKTYGSARDFDWHFCSAHGKRVRWFYADKVREREAECRAITRIALGG
jgi:hypothetical protein